MASSHATGDLCLVLHAHLPFVRHAEHPFHLEEQWLYEAVAATYLPLLELLQGLERDHVAGSLTLSISPPLCTMLDDALLRERTRAYLVGRVTLGQRELERTRHDGHFHYLAQFYHARFSRLLALYDAIGGDIVSAFAQLQTRGRIEIITVGATHGFLPTISDPVARRAQIEIACQHYHQRFGHRPRGIWLPECGYAEGVDRLLADAGIRFAFVDSHGLLNARPRPPHGVWAPIYSPAGVAFFARDAESGKQVWSAREGYPGDGLYRDFYRDIGFDLPLDQVQDFVHPDGIRVNTGYKYFRVTGADVGLGDKQRYDPHQAEARASVHAGNFMFNREHQLQHLATQLGRRPLIVAPYDAELFGHWWFEGPWFLEFLARKIAFDQSTISLTTPLQYLANEPVQVVSEPSPSSWGEGGFSAVWIDASNDWIYRHTHRAERKIRELAARAQTPTDLERRALNQAARELLLAQSSDWAFIMKTGTTVEYAVDRIKSHLSRFGRIASEVERGQIDNEWLTSVEDRDRIFPTLDYRIYQ